MRFKCKQVDHIATQCFNNQETNTMPETEKDTSGENTEHTINPSQRTKIHQSSTPLDFPPVENAIIPISRPPQQAQKKQTKQQ